MNQTKIAKKGIVEISVGDRKMLKLVKVASELVLREDKRLFKELAKH
ncbi:hypothetical protein HZA98_00085 [Candidatus Woesearchaeota archaeon]|nr:hypothetical protein [Candidatus Woesearchaeota archaeon]